MWVFWETHWRLPGNYHLNKSHFPSEHFSDLVYPKSLCSFSFMCFTILFTFFTIHTTQHRTTTIPLWTHISVVFCTFFSATVFSFTNKCRSLQYLINFGLPISTVFIPQWYPFWTESSPRLPLLYMRFHLIELPSFK